jgi:hypothetical protein
MAIGKDIVQDEVTDRCDDEGSCLRKKRGDMQQVEQRKRASKREEDPTNARYMVAQAASLPGASMEVSKCETVIEHEVRDNRDFRAHNESCSKGYEAVGDLQEGIVHAGEAKQIHHGPKPSNTEKFEKPYNRLVIFSSMSVRYLSYHIILILFA